MAMRSLFGVFSLGEFLCHLIAIHCGSIHGDMDSAHIWFPVDGANVSFRAISSLLFTTTCEPRAAHWLWTEGTAFCTGHALFHIRENFVLAGFRQMRAALEILEQQYTAKVLRPDADEDLPPQHLERGIRSLKGGKISVSAQMECTFRYNWDCFCA